MKCARRSALLGVAVGSVALLLTGCGGSKRTRRADQQWANAACASLLAWQKALHHADSSLNLAYSPSARLNDAVGATTRLAKRLTTLGLPTAQPTGNTTAHATKRPSDLQAQITDLGLAMLATKTCRQLGGAPT